MATTIKIGEEVTVGDTAVEYVIDESTAKIDKPSTWLPVQTNSSNSGTIKFAVGVTPPAAQEAVAAGEKRLYFGIENGVNNLWAVGSAAGQKFTIG